MEEEMNGLSDSEGSDFEMTPFSNRSFSQADKEGKF